MALSNKIRLMITAPLLGVVGLVFGSIGISDYNTASSLKGEGVEVSGKVVDGQVKTGRRNSKTYYLTVSYEPKPGDSPTQKEFKVSKSGFDKAQLTPEVQIRILPSDPKVAQLVGEENNGLIFLAFSAGALIASIFMFTRIFK
jgi:Protein of unknown function (DUF3592)